ncbi:hypothetical protein [Enterocloster bolteae]|uniref:hypothetical protein n=1 Tax=Enterocloster bolteae TaxID=208479 RepID=UPI002109F83B|nr:hypothetical protein [Enterocloster bolteae]MCQ5143416.1 hypothetical protein [Enterocloster bolteae]
MKDIAVVDRVTGELEYFVVEENGVVYREYPDGHTEPASKEETARSQLRRKTSKTGEEVTPRTRSAPVGTVNSNRQSERRKYNDKIF